MKRLNILAASLTLSAAAFAANGALANCADELAQLKSEVGSMANTGSAASGMQASDSSNSMASGSSTGDSNANSTMSADSSASGSSASSSNSSDGGQKMAADKTPGDMDQEAVTKNDPTFTAAGSNEGQSDRPDSTGALSGIAPTAALTDEASGNDDASEQAAASSSSTSGQSSGSGSDDQMTTSSTDGSSSMSAPEGSSMSGDQTMVTSHIAAAQMALDSGNEDACMAAVEQARQSM